MLGNDKHYPIQGHAIHAAVYYNQNEILDKLLTISREYIEDTFTPEKGAICKNFTPTPILLAISLAGDNFEIVKTLLSYGACLLSQKFSVGFHIMLEKGNVKILDYLVK